MKTRDLIAATALVGGLFAAAQPAQAQEKYIAEIFITGSNFCPRSTAEANGQLLPIAQNTALFSLLGTMYGGDGRTTFALPDLRNRVPVHSDGTPGVITDTEPIPRPGQGRPMPPRMETDASEPEPPQAVAGPSTLSVKYCIVLQGLYPSRN